MDKKLYNDIVAEQTETCERRTNRRKAAQQTTPKHSAFARMERAKAQNGQLGTSLKNKKKRFFFKVSWKTNNWQIAQYSVLFVPFFSRI